MPATIKLRFPWVSRGELVFFAVALTVYALATHHRSIGHIPYHYMAQAFLNGSVSVANPPPELIETITVGSKHYWAYGVMPAILMMPFVAIWGLAVNQAVVVIILGALNVALMYRILSRLDFDETPRVLLTTLFGFGTVHFHAAAWATIWFFMHVAGIFFLLLAINESLGRGCYFLAGLFFGAAVLSRNPILFAAPFFLVLLFDQEKPIPALLEFGAGLVPCLLFNMWYNFIRFGSVFDNGYGHIWQQAHGMFSPLYLRRNLWYYFLAPPEWLGRFPWLRPGLEGMSFFLTTPAFVYLFRGWRRDPVVIGSWIAVAATWALYLVYFHAGFAQFGPRYTLDFMPFLIILTGVGFGRQVGSLQRVLVLLSILIATWGVAWWRFGGLNSP